MVSINNAVISKVSGLNFLIDPNDPSRIPSKVTSYTLDKRELEKVVEKAKKKYEHDQEKQKTVMNINFKPRTIKKNKKAREDKI